MRIRGTRPQGTSSEPVVRNPLGRPKETLTTVELPPKHKLNNFEIRIPSNHTDNTTESVHSTDHATELNLIVRNQRKLRT